MSTIEPIAHERFFINQEEIIRVFYIDKTHTLLYPVYS